MTPSRPAHLASVTPREDMLVSVCFAHVPAGGEDFDSIEALAAEIDAHFRFREIIVVSDESKRDVYLPLIRRVNNLRLFLVRDGTAFYRRRVIAAEEAIGDVVLLASPMEIDAVSPAEMMSRAADEQCVVLATRGSRISHRGVGALLVLLGRAAGFKVDPRDLQTLALPRTLLNQLLAHPDPDLALRFPPRDVRVPLGFVEVAPGISVPRDGGWQRRIVLLQKVLVYMAPTLLMAVTLTSALLAGSGGLYGIYVMGVWLTLDNVAPGWLTLSAITSLTAFFLGVSIMGLSLGLQQLLARGHRDTLDGVAAEVNRIDLFGQVASDLNVNFERERPSPRHGPTP